MLYFGIPLINGRVSALSPVNRLLYSAINLTSPYVNPLNARIGARKLETEALLTPHRLSIGIHKLAMHSTPVSDELGTIKLNELIRLQGIIPFIKSQAQAAREWAEIRMAQMNKITSNLTKMLTTRQEAKQKDRTVTSLTHRALYA